MASLRSHSGGRGGEQRAEIRTQLSTGREPKCPLEMMLVGAGKNKISGLLPLSTLAVWSQMSPGCGASRALHGGALNARSTLSPELRQAQTSTDATQCPLGVDSPQCRSPGLRTAHSGLKLHAGNSKPPPHFASLTN